MLDAPDPPDLEPDASRADIPLTPRPDEYGSWSWARDIANHIARMLGGEVLQMVARENPWHRKPCPRACAYELTVRDRQEVVHAVTITTFEATRPLTRGTDTAFAIHLNGVRVPYERHRAIDPRTDLATVAWIAISAQHLPLDRRTPGAPPGPGRLRLTVRLLPRIDTGVIP